MEKSASYESKLPAITFTFWVMKICATTLGETAGDLLSMTLDIGYAKSSILLFSCFILSLTAQLSAKRFYPFLYWLVILTTSTAGTTISDYMDRTLGLGYMLGSAVLLGALLIILFTWRLSLGTLEVSKISNVKAEVFYWMAILISNTLGTALGDFLADDSGLGFLGGALIVGAAIAGIGIAYSVTTVSRVLLFWLAFILTRPFGATLGDVLTKPFDKGGLNFGTIGSSAVLGIILVILVLFSHQKLRSQRLAAGLT